MSEPHKPIVPYTEDEQNQASVAHNYFKQNQFDSVLGVVKKLLKNHPNDLCLMHNKVLTEFYKSGKTKTVEFKKSLSKIHKAFQQLKEEEDVVIKGEKTNHVTLCYNHALVMFNIHQFSEAQSLLEKLYPTLEGVEEQEYVKICLLLIECYLVNCHPAKAESIINDVRLFFPDLEESNKRTDKQPGQVTPEENEWLTNHLRYSRARCYLKQRMIKACKRELKTLTTHPQHNMPNVATVFLRSNFEFARCNYHKAYKLLGTSPTTAENNVLYDNLNTMCDNNLAVIYSSMGKYHLGNFYMEKALKENEIWINTALKQQNNGGKGSNNYPISILRMNKRYELLYNRGIQLLHGGDASSAFDCFITVAQVYHSNPRLWLRIAECCIHKCTTASENEESGKRKATNRNYSKVGIGPHRKVVITPSNLNLGRGCNMAVPSPTMEFASIALANALLIMERCMKASGCIQHTGNEVKILEDKLSDIIIACHPGHPVIGARGCQLYASVLCNSAFVALHLGNPGLAWSYSARVLTVPKLFGSHRYLAHMYAGEALVMMDRISEAIQFFQVDKINSVASTNDDGGKRSPLSDDGSNKSGNSNEDSRICKPATRQKENSRWPYPTNLPTAHSHILLNLAVCHCLRSENEKSLRLLRQGCVLEQGKSPNQMVMLAVYLALSGGNIENAIEILHHNNPLINVDQSAIDVSIGSYNHEASSANHKTGAMTPDRVVKATKNEGKNKRNRR